MMFKTTVTFTRPARHRTPAVLALGILLLAALTVGPALLAAAQQPPVEATKTVSDNTIVPGTIIEYTVIFSNTSLDPVNLDEIRDTLPAGFTWTSTGPGDITGDPTGATGTIVWTGPYEVAPGGTRTLIYNVFVQAPPSTTPYTNHVEADLSTGETIIAEVGVTIEGPSLTMVKSAGAAFVPDRDPLEYTVIILNNGSATATISEIADVLPGQFRFLSMVSGPLGNPTQTGQDLVWTQAIDVPVGGTLQFTYRVRADGTVGLPHTNSITASYNGLVAGPATSTVWLTSSVSKAFLPLVIRAVEAPPEPPAMNKLAYETKPSGNYEIYSVEVDGTDVFNISNLTGGDLDPDWSPDGTRVAWEHYGGNAEIYVANADGTNGINATNRTGDDLDPEWKPDGTQILFRSYRDGRWDLFVMNPDGTNQQKLTGGLLCQSTLGKWSPDGAKIGLICGLDANAEVYVMNADGSNPVRLTNDDDADMAINWSPDNTLIVYVRQAVGYDSEMFHVNVNTGFITRLTTNAENDFAPMFSPDGTKIVFTHEYSNAEVAVMNIDGTGMTNLTNAAGGDNSPQWSPDGTLIAFISNRDGNKELYVMNANGSGQFRLTSTLEDEINFDWWPKP